MKYYLRSLISVLSKVQVMENVESKLVVHKIVANSLSVYLILIID